MMKKTHLMAGLALSFMFNLDPVMVVAGALMPDLDYIIWHRKLLHNVFVLIGAFLYNFAFGIGWLSHLLLDGLTMYGVAWFWPIYRRRIRLAKFKTGGIVDSILFIVFLVLWIIFDVKQFM